MADGAVTLIVFAGLPGTGKSTLSLERAIGRQRRQERGLRELRQALPVKDPSRP